MSAAASSGMKIDPRLLQSLKGVHLRSQMLVRGMYNNRHRTSDFGSSTEFIDHREYQKGDAIRSIDWRVFARTDRHYVKRHEMEANMRVHLLMDTSDSMRVPPPDGLPSKLELAAAITGAIATMVISQQDAAGLCLVGDKIEERIPARQGMNHLAQLFQHLGAPRGTGGGAFGTQIAHLGGHVQSRGMVFVITDALDELEPLYKAMRNMVARQNDVTLLQVLDQAEVEFPFTQMTEFRHPETGARLAANPSDVRDRYLQRLREHQAALEGFCRKARIDYVPVQNNADLVVLMRSHFLRRLMRRFG